MRAALRTLGRSVELLVLLRPHGLARHSAPDAFFLVVALYTLALMAMSWHSAGENSEFYWLGFMTVAVGALLALLLAWVTTLLVRRPVLLWALASQLLLILLVLQVSSFVWHELVARDAVTSPHWREYVNLWPILGLWVAASVWRFHRWAEPWRGHAAGTLLGIACAAAIVSSHLLSSTPGFFFARMSQDGLAPAAPPAPRFDAEALLSTQVSQVAAAGDRIERGTPGEIDLFVVAFGGDGDETVFRNEVEYVQQLFARRFGAQDRVLVLLNNPATLQRFPLATRTNLDAAMQVMATKMDRDEDILLLFMTSHGSADHHLYVGLDQLPLNQLDADDIAKALGKSAARWRATIVSACYSGGFLEALQGDDALVVTAARHDRTSFGCGTESVITDFGRAYLVEALNETGDLAEAFRLASERIEEREEAADVKRSYPQIAPGDAFAVQWQAWMRTHPLGPPVAFDPVVPDPGAPSAASDGRAQPAEDQPSKASRADDAERGKSQNKASTPEAKAD